MHAVLSGKADTPADPVGQIVGRRITKEYEVKYTFCECCAISSTSEKSYMPRAVSNSRSASTKKIMYFTASSTKSGSDSVQSFSDLFPVKYNNHTDLLNEVKVQAQPHGPEVASRRVPSILS